MSITGELVKHALRYNYCNLPSDVIHQVKRLLLDTLGCAVGAYSSETAKIIAQQMIELGGVKESTIIGNGLKTTCLNAAFINGAMVRYLDFNDTAFIIQDETYRTGYHPSEVIPPILAVAERNNASGKDIITSIVLGYDLSLGFLKGAAKTGMEIKGWNGDTRGAYIVPIIIGKLLGLSEEQIVNAVGISGSCNAVLGILDSPAEEYTMTKNIRFPSMAYNGMLSALLAQKGFTGPTTIIEGQNGFNEVIMNNEYDTNKLSGLNEKYAIRYACIKSIIADYSSHGHLTATLTLVKNHNIKPEDVAEVIITTSKRCAEHTGDKAKRYPTNKETADHSAYYLTAIAIIDKQIGPSQFSSEKYDSHQVKKLIDKITLIGDPTLDKKRPSGKSEIITKSGQKFSIQVDYPRGHAHNQMTDQEIVDKFDNMASAHMSRSQIEQLVEEVFNLENIDDVCKILELLTFEKR